MMITNPNRLLEDKAAERFEEFMEMIINQMAVIFQIPVELIKQNYGKETRS